MKSVLDKNLVKLFEKGTVIKYRPGEIIIRADDNPLGVYYLKKGYVKQYSSSIDGKELIINIYKPQSYFPIVWLLAGVKNTYYFETLNNATVYRLSRVKVLKFLEENPISMKFLAKRLSSGIVGLSKLIDVMYSGTAKQKIVFILVQLGVRFGREGEEGEIKVRIPATHQMISEMAGLARETTSIEMQKLKEKKIINYSRKSLKILNMNKLKRLSLEVEAKKEIVF